MRLLLCLLTASVLPAFSLHSSEAGVVDWHKTFIGLPLTASPATAPVFHRVGDEDGPTRSVILTATESNILAALHPENGSVAWRHIFEERDFFISYKKHESRVAALSGPGGAVLRIFDSLAGHLIFEKSLHPPESGRLFEPANVGVALAFDANENKDVYALSDGHTIRRVNGQTGETSWTSVAVEEMSTVVYSDVVSTTDTIYLVGLAKSFASYTIHLKALSASSGTYISNVNVPSNIKGGPDEVLILSPKGASPQVVWIEDGRIHSFELTPDLRAKSSILKGAVYKTIHDIGLREEGYFVAIKEDGSGRVIKLGLDGLKVIWEFAESASSHMYTGSIYTGGLDKDKFPYIARVYWSHVYKKASAHIFAPHLADGKGLVTGFTFPFETASHGIITHVAMDAANPEEFRVLSRLVLTTSTGAVQLWQQDQIQWVREEGLSSIQVAEMVELPEAKIVASQVGAEEHETFSSRLLRQLTDAQDFPQYLLKFVKRFATGSYASVSAPVAKHIDASGSLSRDIYGFRKIIVAATTHGKVYGIDSSNGEIIWSRVFGLGWAAEVGGQIFPLKIFTTRSVSEGDTPQVVIVTQRKANNGLKDTVAFYIEALTGEDVTGKSVDVLEGQDIIAGPVVEAFLFRNETAKYVILFDEFLQTHIFPNSPDNEQSFKKIVKNVHFALRTGPPGARRLSGHKISPQAEFTGRHVAYSTWTTAFGPDEDIKSIITRPYEPVASYGKVLGNRTTLYKYLNPNMIVVLTGSSTGPSKSCGIYAIDAAKGSVLYHAVVPAPGGFCDVKATLTENWLVYHYYDDEIAGVDQAKSYRMVSVEFYEGEKIDDKIKSSDLSSYSNDTTSISIYEQGYVFPRAISTIATTSTKFGITIKDVIVAGQNHQVQSFPRRALDPRRPKRKPTNEEAEEWLVQYDPLLPDDPKRVLSHKYQVARLRQIITSPALLESTSLVFGYGLDLFSTRVAPSNTFDVLSETFNKAQLVLTVAGLAFAIVITKPMVHRKRLRERWYD
ncbi:ER membrane protein complex subunit 1 [Abortiporus biennis]